MLEEKKKEAAINGRDNFCSIQREVRVACLMHAVHKHFIAVQQFDIVFRLFSATNELGYNDLGLCDTSDIAS
jgi:hypothetical protein